MDYPFWLRRHCCVRYSGWDADLFETSPVRFVYLESVASKRGEIVFKREGCFGCHEMLANGATYGPNLDGIGSRRTKDWLTEFMKAPRSGVSAKPYRLKMPPYNNLAPSDMRDLVSYLMAFRESQKG